MSTKQVARLRAEVAHLMTRLSAIKKKVTVTVEGPTLLDDCSVEGWSLPISGGSGKFTAKDEVALTPKQIPVDVLVTGQRGTKVDVSVKINGVPKSRSFRMEGQHHGKRFYFTFKDFNLPE